MKTRLFLYLVLAAGVLFDLGAGAYLWHLTGERKNQRMASARDHRTAPSSRPAIKGSRPRPAYSIH